MNKKLSEPQSRSGRCGDDENLPPTAQLLHRLRYLRYVGSFNDADCSTSNTTSNNGMASKQRIRQDLEESDRGLILYTIQVFTWKRRKHKKR